MPLAGVYLMVKIFAKQRALPLQPLLSVEPSDLIGSAIFNDG